MPAVTANDVVAMLALEPHPEGGFYRETFRDDAPTESGRAASTAIYFLLPQGVISCWHRVDATEAWHYYAGAPLALTIVAPGGGVTTLRLGVDLASGERPQGIVPRGHWQQAESLGAWTLVGCTVAPGFEFAGFEMAAAGWRPGS